MKIDNKTICLMGLLTSVLLFISCKSVPDQVKKNKAKFIQVARENSKPISMDEVKDLLETAQGNNTEAKLKYLGMDNMTTVYNKMDTSKPGLDSVVIFSKSNYKILYDFTELGRSFDDIQNKSNLKNFEKIDERLYLGKE